MNQLFVSLLNNSAIRPTKAYPSDSGFDVYSLNEEIFSPFQTKVVKTGLTFELPVGFELQVRPRSGVSTKTPLRVIFGTVDNGFRGELGIMCQNTSGQTFTIPAAYKLAQVVPNKIPEFELVFVDDLNNSNRGSNGFGSSGV